MYFNCFKSLQFDGLAEHYVLVNSDAKMLKLVKKEYLTETLRFYSTFISFSGGRIRIALVQNGVLYIAWKIFCENGNKISMQN